MAKPILVIRLDHSFFSEDQVKSIRETVKDIEKEYHVLWTSVGAPKQNISFEVHGVAQTPDFGDLKTTISGSDLNIIWKRKGGEGG